MRDRFNADEWATVAEAPLLAAARVAYSDDGGAFREERAVGRVYAAARDMRGESALLDALVEDPPSHDLDRFEGATPEGINQRLQAAIAVLQQRVPAEDVDAYKGFVLAVIQTAAEANREGGFAGIGGEEVSAQEQAVLDEISAVMGAEAASE